MTRIARERESCVQIPAATRRAILAVGAAAASALGFAAPASAVCKLERSNIADPVLQALESYAQARANNNIAMEEYCRLEREHHGVVFYRPRVRLGTNIIYADEGRPEIREEVFAYSEAEIRYSFYGNDDARIKELTEKLNADRERHQRDLERIGFPRADREHNERCAELCEAEKTVLAAVPTTSQGAIELARFGANLAGENLTDSDDLAAAFRTLTDWLIKHRAEG